MEITCSLCNSQVAGACLLKGKINDSQDKACDKFVLKDTFWCVKSCAWLDVIVCTARRVKESEICNNCRQGEMVSKALKMKSRKESGDFEERSNGKGRRPQSLE
jgi:hypothetical protein